MSKIQDIADEASNGADLSLECEKIAEELSKLLLERILSGDPRLRKGKFVSGAIAGILMMAMQKIVHLENKNAAYIRLEVITIVNTYLEKLYKDTIRAYPDLEKEKLNLSLPFVVRVTKDGAKIDSDS